MDASLQQPFVRRISGRPFLRNGLEHLAVELRREKLAHLFGRQLAKFAFVPELRIPFASLRQQENLHDELV